MTGELDVFLRSNGALTLDDYPKHLEGRLVRFDRSSDSILGRPSYNIHTQRGGWLLGWLEFRNQWQMYAYRPANAAQDIPLNKVMLAEIFAMMKGLDAR